MGSHDNWGKNLCLPTRNGHWGKFRENIWKLSFQCSVSLFENFVQLKGDVDMMCDSDMSLNVLHPDETLSSRKMFSRLGALGPFVSYACGYF